MLENWLQAPRYGFLSQFEAGRNNIDATMSENARYHVNGLQFYDWQYRHEALVPPEDNYSDLLGRHMSLETVRKLIDAAHARNIAAMPYTAIYGASVAFYRAHPDWALFERPDQPYEFGDNFLIIMDPSPDSPWTDHLMNEFGRVLDDTAVRRYSPRSVRRAESRAVTAPASGSIWLKRFPVLSTGRRSRAGQARRSGRGDL